MFLLMMSQDENLGDATKPPQVQPRGLIGRGNYLI